MRPCMYSDHLAWLMFAFMPSVPCCAYEMHTTTIPTVCVDKEAGECVLKLHSQAPTTVMVESWNSHKNDGRTTPFKFLKDHYV